MKALRKSQLSVALGAALATMATIPLTAYGVTFDAASGYFLPNDGGDAVIYPVYTAVGNNTTAFSLTNSGNRSIAAKVRFREQKNSMDVWDTIIFLSPGDKWDFFVRAGAGGVPEVNIDPQDETCTMVPPSGPNGNGFPSPFRPSAFVSSADVAAGVTTVGHVEVIGMMDLTHAVTLYGNFLLSFDAAIKAKNELIPGFANLKGCDALRDIFSNPWTVADPIHGIQFAEDVPNDLIGRWLINGGGTSGIEAGNDPLLIANLFEWDDFPERSDPESGCSGGCGGPLEEGYKASQSFDLCDGGIGSCAEIPNKYTWDAQQMEHPHLGDAEFEKLANIDRRLGADWLMGDWSNNAANDVGADWIASFVGRYTHTDYLDCNKADGKEWCWVKGSELAVGIGGSGDRTYPPTNPFASSSVTYEAPGPVGCLPSTLWVRDVDERIAVPVASPLDLPALCNEVNIFTIAKLGETVRDSLIQQNTGPFARTILRYEYFDINVVRGWAELQLLWPNRWAEDGGVGAVDGNLFILRNTANPDQNNATLSDLQKWTDED